jgi:hypothetical protein
MHRISYVERRAGDAADLPRALYAALRQLQLGVPAQLAAQYPWVEVFGCQGAVDELTARFAGSYQRIAAGDNYAALSARRGAL